MDAHQNARTTPHSRQLIVRRLAQGWTARAVALALGIDPKTVRKWRDRLAAEGLAGLTDRSSRPHTSPTRLDAAAVAVSRGCAGSACPGRPSPGRRDCRSPPWGWCCAGSAWVA